VLLTRSGLSRIAARFGEVHGEKNREGRQQKPPEEEKRRERTCFCDSKILNEETCRKLTGRGETTAFTLTSDGVFSLTSLFY
jgi:hypothetical protein